MQAAANAPCSSRPTLPAPTCWLVHRPGISPDGQLVALHGQHGAHHVVQELGGGARAGGGSHVVGGAHVRLQGRGGGDARSSAGWLEAKKPAYYWLQVRRSGGPRASNNPPKTWHGNCCWPTTTHLILAPASGDLNGHQVLQRLVHSCRAGGGAGTAGVSSKSSTSLGHQRRRLCWGQEAETAGQPATGPQHNAPRWHISSPAQFMLTTLSPFLPYAFLIDSLSSGMACSGAGRGQREGWGCRTQGWSPAHQQFSRPRDSNSTQ